MSTAPTLFVFLRAPQMSGDELLPERRWLSIRGEITLDVSSQDLYPEIPISFFARGSVSQSDLWVGRALTGRGRACIGKGEQFVIRAVE